MDTRFWGPDGWKLLHSIAVSYPTNPTNVDKETYLLFFNCLKYVLPCIYCRRSYTEYIGILPIEDYLASNLKLSEWLYKLHNLVNDKLRKQGLHNNIDPPFKDIHKLYIKYVKEINESNCTNMPGWDFIYSILFNYTSKSEIENDRYVNYIIFFNYLPKVIPFIKAKSLLQKYLDKYPIKNYLDSREKLTKWGYLFEHTLSSTISCNCANYEARKEQIEMYRAGCGGKKDLKPTCRLGNSPKEQKK